MKLDDEIVDLRQWDALARAGRRHARGFRVGLRRRGRSSPSEHPTRRTPTPRWCRDGGRTELAVRSWQFAVTEDQAWPDPEERLGGPTANWNQKNGPMSNSTPTSAYSFLDGASLPCRVGRRLRSSRAIRRWRLRTTMGLHGAMEVSAQAAKAARAWRRDHRRGGHARRRLPPNAAVRDGATAIETSAG